MALNYSFQQYDPKKMVKLGGRNLSISKKDSMEICAFIKGKRLDDSVAYLEAVILKKKAIPFKRFRSHSHRKGEMAAGRFPVNASKLFKKLLLHLKKNAENKGLDQENLIIIHAAANPGPILMHYGRHRGKRKNTHIELAAEETEKKQVKPKKKVAPAKKAVKKQAPKPAAPKPVEKKVEQPKEEPKVEKKEEIVEEPKQEATAPKKEEKKPVDTKAPELNPPSVEELMAKKKAKPEVMDVPSAVELAEKKKAEEEEKK